MNSSSSHATIPSYLTRYWLEIERELDSLVQEFGSYDSEILNRQPAPGSWSAMQCVEHLKLSEAAIFGYISKKLSFDPELPKRGFADRWRRFLLLAYLASPVKFKAPKGIGTAHLPDRSEPKPSFAEWRKIRQDIRQTLETIDPKYYDRQVFKHPLAGRVGLETTLAFMLAHLRRHRRQMRKAVRN